MATGKMQSIRDSCKMPPDQRTEEQVNDILDVVKGVKFFQKLTSMQQRELCRHMTIEEFAAREFVFHKDDVGDKFYVILSGNCSVQVPDVTAPCPRHIHSDPAKCDCPDRPCEKVTRFEKGHGFGELALQSAQLRSATIQAIDKTELLVTTRNDYELYAGQLHRNFVESRVKFLRQCHRIEDALQRCLVTTHDIAAMANFLNEQSLSGNEIVVRQGEVVDHMIFVVSGQLAMLRSVDIDECREMKHQKRARAALAMTKPSSRGQGGGGGGGTGQNVSDPFSDTTLKPGEVQSKTSLSTNFAKALVEMRRQDRMMRRANFTGDEDHQSISIIPNDAKSSTYTVRSSNGLVGLPASLANQIPSAADSPRKSIVGEGANPSTKMQPRGSVQGQAMWKRLRGAVKQAGILGRLVSGGDDEADLDEETGEQAAHRNVQHFADVSAARRKVTSYKFRQMQEERNVAKSVIKGTVPNRHGRRHQSVMATTQADKGTVSQQAPEGSPSPASDAALSAGQSQPPRRRRLLRIGTVGPYQYFGDQQVVSGEVFPVSLVSDPVAEIYMMNKNDIVRRLPKKLFQALFTSEKEVVPSDLLLLDMHRQTERWSSFRRSMHGGAMVKGAREDSGVPRSLRDPTSTSRVDVLANLEFLGVSPQGSLAKSLLPPPQARGAALTAQDEEHFSQASARFLTRFENIKRDPRLRNALAKAGLMKLHSDGLDDVDDLFGMDAELRYEKDPMQFRFDQDWSKLRSNLISDLDLGEDALIEEGTKASGSRQSTLTRRQSALSGTGTRLSSDLETFGYDSEDPVSQEVFGGVSRHSSSNLTARAQTAGSSSRPSKVTAPGPRAVGGGQRGKGTQPQRQQGDSFSLEVELPVISKGSKSAPQQPPEVAGGGSPKRRGPHPHVAFAE